jgi:hypothetical protein
LLGMASLSTSDEEESLSYSRRLLGNNLPPQGVICHRHFSSVCRTAGRR